MWIIVWSVLAALLLGGCDSDGGSSAESAATGTTPPAVTDLEDMPAQFLSSTTGESEEHQSTTVLNGQRVFRSSRFEMTISGL